MERDRHDVAMRAATRHPTVSIITPSFNQGGFLADAIESVTAHSRRSIQHLIYDACSTDDTPAVLAAYADRVSAVVEPDDGQASAVNRGLREASGEILGWLNSDDFYFPGAIDAVVDYMRAHPDCMVLYGSAQYVDEHGAKLGPYPTGDPGDLRYGCFICQPTVFLRRRAVEVAGMLDESLRYCMDYDWWLRLRQHFQLHRIPNELAAYRLHGRSKSIAEQLQSRREVVEVTRRRLGATPLTCLYGFASFRARQILGIALDDAIPLGLLGRATAAALTGALALRYHPLPTRDDLRLLAARLGRARALRPGDFVLPGS
jgi:glycosyltransferase involved in cell wall biosynthesis